MARAGCQVTSEMALLVGAEKGTLFCLVEGLSQERSSAATPGAPGCNLYMSWALTQEPAGTGSFLLLGQRLHKHPAFATAEERVRAASDGHCPDEQ